MYNRRAVLAALMLVALVVAPPGPGGFAPALGASPRTQIRGFAPDALERERSDEATFLGIPSASGALAHANVIHENTHFAGTWGDRHLTEYMRDQLKEFGFQTSIETYTERLEWPDHLALALVRPRRVNFDLHEVPDESDPDSARGATLPFNYGSADGNVTAPLVYVNRGLDADYDALAKANVDVKGALAIVRYGAQFRGLLAERAQQHGAAGVIFYSDPKDDGYGRGAAYPKGPWRPAGSVQRGSVSGDVPLHIPTLPVTANVAQQLLATIAGTPVPRAWEGALPISYSLGRGPGTAHLSVKIHRVRGAIWNTIGIMPGRSPDRTVILGGHRDAWVFGVTDNGSGIATLLEVARGLGYLKSGGWIPKRTIVIAGWDAEELGEYGSRDYVRAHWQALRRGGVAYLNADEIVAGPSFSVQSVAALTGTIVAASHEVTDPVRNTSIYDRWLADQRQRRNNGQLDTPVVEAPGGGSDHESFLHDVGMPVALMGFTGPLGVYHSVYDDLRYAERFADPGFALHRTAAQILGLVAMRIADADTVPYEFTPYVAAMSGALDNITKQTAAIALKPDFTALRAAIGRFAKAAGLADASIASNGTISEDRLLLAAQSLDRVFYGTLGYDDVSFPAIAQALAKNDPSALASAIGTTTAAIDAVTSSLTP